LAILSAICDEEKVDYDCIDFSLKIWQNLPSDFEEIDNFCITRIIRPRARERLTALVKTTVEEVLAQHPDTIFAMSMLSMWSQPVCEIFCQVIREVCGNEILIGGQGIGDEKWTYNLKEQKQIDHYIVGEGEITFRKFLQGHRDLPGLNNFNFEQIDDLDAYCVIPNYTKLLVNKYPFLNERQDLFITASRGCVRNCSYCDIGHQWKKFRYRSANHVAQEMIAQFERHGIKDFFFTDSLINGSMKMLNELCDILIEYKEKRPDADFKWRGQYIFRPKELVKEAHIEKMVKAGVDYLIVGLETGSDRVRHDMNKKHTTDDAEWFLEMFKKYGITCHLLMITGWVTETLEDHQDTLNLFPRWQKFVASGTITGIELGSTLMILEHAPVGYAVNDLEIRMINDKPYLWQSGVNPDLTVAERVRRRIETHYEAMKYHWPITRSLYRLNTVKRNLMEAIEFLKSNPEPKPKRTFKLINSA
jgi:hypothetical protein